MSTRTNEPAPDDRRNRRDLWAAMVIVIGLSAVLFAAVVTDLRLGIAVCGLVLTVMGVVMGIDRDREH